MKKVKICLAVGLLLAAIPLVMNAEKPLLHYGMSRYDTVSYGPKGSDSASSGLFLLSWEENPDPVGYELEIAEGEGTWEADAPSGKAVYRIPKLYVPGTVISASSLPAEAEKNDHLYWRVRPFDLDGNPLHRSR